MKKALLMAVVLAWAVSTACGPVLQPATQGEWSNYAKKDHNPTKNAKPKAE